MNFDLQNFTIAAPLLALAAGALVILLLDLLIPAKAGQGLWYIFGILSVLLAGYYLIPLWDGQMAPGFGGAMMMDRFAVVFSLILLLAAGLTLLLSVSRKEEDKSGYLALLLWGAMGMIIMASSGSLMTIFLGLELLSLALYVAVAFDPTHPHAREAALKYFVLGSLASAFMLFGFALVYGVTGTMSLAGIAKAAIPQTLYYKVGIGMAMVGMAFKLALVPFHSWAPDAYEGAPTAITAYMSVGTKAAAFAVMARFLVAAVPAGVAGKYLLPLSVLAALSMLLGATVGIWQNDLKRLMAYSGIAHAGYLIMAIPGLSSDGLTAGAYYLAAYAFTAMGIFAVISLLESEGEPGSSLANLNGLWYRRPGLAVSLAFLMFGLAGLPPTGGFIGKFLLAKAAVGSGSWILLGALVLSTGISAYVYLRVVGALIKKQPEHARKVMAGAEVGALELPAGTVRAGILAVLVIALVGLLLLGVVPGPVLEFLKVAIRV
ncbi:MAG TPA: NADH-quinone oxidoreductase subunit N [Symbiobacteriaceae bacterium]